MRHYPSIISAPCHSSHATKGVLLDRRKTSTVITLYAYVCRCLCLHYVHTVITTSCWDIVCFVCFSYHLSIWATALMCSKLKWTETDPIVFFLSLQCPPLFFFFAIILQQVFVTVTTQQIHSYPLFADCSGEIFQLPQPLSSVTICCVNMHNLDKFLHVSQSVPAGPAKTRELRPCLNLSDFRHNSRKSPQSNSSLAGSLGFLLIKALELFHWWNFIDFH